MCSEPNLASATGQGNEAELIQTDFDCAELPTQGTGSAAAVHHVQVLLNGTGIDRFEVENRPGA
jgi:hypothetical protein